MKLKNYITESKSWNTGDWIVQKRSGENEFGIVVEILKNGSAKAITCDDAGSAASIKSIKGWYPNPVAVLKNEVPLSIVRKITNKLFKSKYSDILK